MEEKQRSGGRGKWGRVDLRQWRERKLWSAYKKIVGEHQNREIMCVGGGVIGE